MGNLAMNEMTTYSWSFEQDIQKYAAAGITAASVWRQKLSDFGEQKGIELLAENSVSVAALFWAGGFTGSDGRSHKESIQDAHDAIRLAADLRAGCLVIYTGSRAGHTLNHAKRLVKNALKELLPIAEEFNVPLAIEPVHAACAEGWSFLTDLDATMALLDAFGSDQLKFVFDTYHCGRDEADIARLAELAGRIALVQLGDSREAPRGEQNRCRLGDGNLPLDVIVARLEEAAYDGYYDVELMGEDVEHFDYDELIAHSKAAFERLLPQV